MAGTGDNMKNDHQYAEVLEMMRSQGAKDNPTLAQIGVMQSSNSVKIDDLVLNAEDLYIADYLVAGYTRQIKVPYVAGVSVDTTQSNGFASKDNPDPDTRVWKQSQITYTDGLKAGDMVLVQKLTIKQVCNHSKGGGGVNEFISFCNNRGSYSSGSRGNSLLYP